MGSIRLHPSAAEEVEAAFDWYLERSPRAAGAFLNQLNHAISRIQESPEAWPGYYHGTRRYIFSTFPFQVVYRDVDGNIEIIAIAHGRRRPKYWDKRI